MELYSQDNTVDVLLDSGTFLKHVEVRSDEWVIYSEDTEKEYNSGGRDLPPLHTRVFVLMPTRTYNDCFVLCSLFSTPSKAEPFLAEDKERIKEKITPSWWHRITDNDTGSYELISPDKLTSFLLDYGSKDEPLIPSELHFKIFHDEENDDPGIKYDFVSGKTIDLTVFKDFIFHHTKEDIITAQIFEEVDFTHKKGEFISGELFEKEMNFKYEKEKHISGDFFGGETDFAYKKGDSITFNMFGGEASFTHKKGTSTVYKAFDSTITLKNGQVIIKTSNAITHDVPTYKFTGNTSTGRVTPKGRGVYCAIQFCPYSGLPQTG
jgi:hypothetical protein